MTIETSIEHGTGIGWTHRPGTKGETWNPTTGCTQIPGAKGGPSGCDNCYAKYSVIDTRQRFNPKSVRFGKAFEEVMVHPERLDAPLRWTKPRTIFVNSLSDLFHADIPDDFVYKVLDVVAKSPQHTFQVLTKRPERMSRLLSRWYLGMSNPTLLPNLWLGVSIATNADAWRVAHLRTTPALVRFFSLEPLLGPVDQVPFEGIDWIIAGGESGRNARPMHPDWVRGIRDRCADLGIPFFFKQWGDWVPREWKNDGGTHAIAIDDEICEFNHHPNSDARSPVAPDNSRKWQALARVGKHAAGNMLDGMKHEVFPA